MFDFILGARASCGDGTVVGSASEPGEGGQRPGRAGPAAPGPGTGRSHLLRSVAEPLCLSLPCEPQKCATCSASSVSDGVSRGENAPPSTGQAAPRVQSYACPIGSRGHLRGPGTAAYVATCRDEPPRVFSESAAQPCPLQTPYFPVAGTSRGTDLGHGLVLANVRTPRANPQGTARTLLASQLQSRGGCRGAELRLRAASARLSPVRTAMRVRRRRVGPGFRVSKGKTFRVASCWWGFPSDPPYLTGTQTHGSGGVTSEGRRRAGVLPPDAACFLGGQHGGHPDGERVDRSGRDRRLAFRPCASLGSSPEGPAPRAPGTLAPSLLSVWLGLPPL